LLGSRVYECFHFHLASFYLTALLQERDYGRENREKCKVSEWCTGSLPWSPSSSTVIHTTLTWELDHLLPNIRLTNPYSWNEVRVGGLYLVAYSNFKGRCNVFTVVNEAEGTLSLSSLYLRWSLIVKIIQNWTEMRNSLQLLLL
jgi:hypothetical protein